MEDAKQGTPATATATAQSLDSVLGLDVQGTEAVPTAKDKVIYPLAIAETKYNKLVKEAGFNPKDSNSAIGTRLALCTLIFCNLPKDKQLEAVKLLPPELRTFALGINSKK